MSGDGGAGGFAFAEEAVKGGQEFFGGIGLGQENFDVQRFQFFGAQVAADF
jgi:hypothetical protein